MHIQGFYIRAKLLFRVESRNLYFRRHLSDSDVYSRLGIIFEGYGGGLLRWAKWFRQGSLIQQTFIECLQCIYHCAGAWSAPHNSLSRGACCLVRITPTITFLCAYCSWKVYILRERSGPKSALTRLLWEVGRVFREIFLEEWCLNILV